MDVEWRTELGNQPAYTYPADLELIARTWTE